MKTENYDIQKRRGTQTIFRMATDPYGNAFTEFFFGLIGSIIKLPSLFVEVFLRKRLGERYFSFTISLILVAFTFLAYRMLPQIVQRQFDQSWKLFMLFFLIVAFVRRREIKKYGSTYNFDRFSYTDGEKHSFLYNLLGQEFLGIKVNQYILNVYIEPAIPILVGIILSALPFTRSAGTFILISGICYAIRSFLKAYSARSYVLDIADDQIIQEWKYDVLVEGKPKIETVGLGLPIDLPPSRELRESLSQSLENTNPLDIWKKRGEDDSDIESFNPHAVPL